MDLLSLVAALNSVAVDQTVQIDVRLLTILGGSVVPLLTALVTKRLANPGLKAFCTLVLSVIAGAVAVATAANGEIQLNTYIDGITTSFVAAITSYYGIWKPSSIAPRLQKATDSFGLGSNNPLNVDSAWQGSLGSPSVDQSNPIPISTPVSSEPETQPTVPSVSDADAEALANIEGDTSALDGLKADAGSEHAPEHLRE